MKVFIPHIATKFVLEQPWTFSMYSESRNDKFIATLKANRFSIPDRKLNSHGYYGYGVTQSLGDVTLPVDTQLSVSRIYIRLGQKDYDSVSFMANFDVIDPIRQKVVKIKGRFWAKLDDVNKMVVKDV